MLKRTQTWLQFYLFVSKYLIAVGGHRRAGLGAGGGGAGTGECRPPGTGPPRPWRKTGTGRQAGRPVFMSPRLLLVQGCQLPLL